MWAPSGAADLTAVLAEARHRGFLGPGPIESHIEHAHGFVAAVESSPALALDLGSGGGVPGLVLASCWPTSSWVLLDASERRTAFLHDAIAALGLEGRVSVRRARAEEAGHDGALRGTFDLVTARSFGTPAITAECGAPFLRLRGRLAVSEPPSSGARWPAAGLHELGLRAAAVIQTGAARVQLLEAEVACPARFPRRVGVPAKRPLF